MRARRRAVLAVLIVVGWLAAGCGDDGSDDSFDEFEVGGSCLPPAGSEPDELDIEAPDGWRVVPLAHLGFGLAVPGEWQDSVLCEEVYEALAEVSPGFLTLALEAEASGAVFYAAGSDPEDREKVNDLKVRPYLETVDVPVADAAELEAFAREEVNVDQFDHEEVEPVEGWRYPSVDLRYSATYDDALGDGEDIVAHGIDRLVLAPSGVVFSLVVTGEDPDTVDDLATELFETFDFT